MMKQTHIPHIKERDKVILFDGKCKLCNAWCRFIIRHDNANIFKFTSMQSDKGQAILKHLKLPTESFNTILFIENNIVYEKSTAFLKTIRLLSFPIKLLAILQFIPNPFRDAIYSKIARNRYKWFGKYNECHLPVAEQKRRYL